MGCQPRLGGVEKMVIRAGNVIVSHFERNSQTVHNAASDSDKVNSFGRLVHSAAKVVSNQENRESGIRKTGIPLSAAEVSA